MSGFAREQDDFARGARAIVALPDQGGATRSSEARLEEAAGLAEAIGIDVVEKVAFRLRQPKPATLFGSGQVEAIAVAARAHDAELVIVDAPLSPIQQRNLEKTIETKVIDRTGLVLEIFGERAATA
ncbi:GTPase HflX, partial [bacterium]